MTLDNNDYLKMANCFRILSNEIRLKIIDYLRKCKEANVSDLINNLNIKQSILSQQLQVLYNAHIIGKRKEGLYVYYFLINFELADYIKNINNLQIEPLQKLVRVNHHHCHCRHH